MSECLRQQTINQLLTIRDNAAMDLATMPSTKQGTRWHWDRQRDVDYARKQLERLGVTK